MTAVIILNWNGYQDTIACLESLMAVDRQDFLWMVVDNGSTDDSIEQIQAFLENRQIPFVFYKEGDDLTSALQARRGVVYALKENYGFAKGNNLGIELVERSVKAFGPESFFPEYYLLLNNDTEVEPDFLSKLEDFARNHPEYVALTPQIRYMEPNNLVWNCGGRLVFGLRIYNYDRKPCATIKEKGYIPISLITGCALFARRELLGNPDEGLRGYVCPDPAALQRPRLLTERFFFGEEDFDFVSASWSLWLCLPVCASVWNPVKFRLWRQVYMPYIAYALHGYGVSWKEIRQYLKRLWKESTMMDGMDRACFLKWIGEK